MFAMPEYGERKISPRAANSRDCESFGTPEVGRHLSRSNVLAGSTLGHKERAWSGTRTNTARTFLSEFQRIDTQSTCGACSMPGMIHHEIRATVRSADHAVVSWAEHLVRDAF